MAIQRNKMGIDAALPHGPTEHQFVCAVRQNQNRTTITSRIDTLRGNEPWAGYDELTVADKQQRLTQVAPTATRKARPCRAFGVTRSRTTGTSSGFAGARAVSAPTRLRRKGPSVEAYALVMCVLSL